VALLSSLAKSEPAIVELPAPDGELIRLARAVAAASAMLISPGMPELVGMSAKRRGSARVGTCDARFELHACRSTPSHPLSATLNGLRRDAAALVAMLRPRWPDYARPATLGLVSDGVGVAFSPDDPDPFAPGWVARLAGLEIALVQILPLAPSSTLSGMILPTTRAVSGQA
jgi:hypothetical protein